MAAALVLAACSDAPTEPAEADEDDYALVMFGQAGSALEDLLGAQGGRPFDGRTGAPRLPAELQLTHEQRTAIAALREAFRVEHAADIDALRAIFEAARAARDGGATREEVRAILEQGRAIAQALHEDVRALHEAILAVLTDEQAAWLEANRPGPPRGIDGRHHPPLPRGARR